MGFVLAGVAAKACSRFSGKRRRRVCHGRDGNRCFGLLQAVFTDSLLFSVTSCRGSTELSPQDTDPDAPSSTSAVTTETGSDEVFIISAGPGASGLSFTTYRVQVGMLFNISSKPQDIPLGQHLYLPIHACCHLARKPVTKPVSSPKPHTELPSNAVGCDPPSQYLPSFEKGTCSSLPWMGKVCPHAAGPSLRNTLTGKDITYSNQRTWESDLFLPRTTEGSGKLISLL